MVHEAYQDSDGTKIAYIDKAIMRDHVAGARVDVEQASQRATGSITPCCEMHEAGLLTTFNMTTNHAHLTLHSAETTSVSPFANAILVSRLASLLTIICKTGIFETSINSTNLVGEEGTRSPKPLWFRKRSAES